MARPANRAIVIGAGPAGSTAAICLARRGIDVMIIEQHRFPRDKVCGECLSSTGMDVLERVGTSRELVDAGAIELSASALYGPGDEYAVTPLPRPMWGITRRRLDEILLRAAERAGARVLQPARCEAIDAGSVRVRSLEDNSVCEMHADWVFLADGKGVLLGERPRPTGDFGIKAHFAGVNAPRKTIGLYALEGHYVGLAPVEGGRWNLAFSAPLEKVKRFDGDFDALLRDAMTQNRALAQHLAQCTRTTDWLASALPRFAVAATWPANVVPLGNAAAAIEPIGGEGMGLAMASAEMAVERLGEDRADQSAREDFSRLWGVRSAACRLAAMIMSRPGLSGAAVELIGANERVVRAVMGWMGKR